MTPVITFFFFFQAEDGIRDWSVTGVQTCALPIYTRSFSASLHRGFERRCAALKWTRRVTTHLGIPKATRPGDAGGRHGARGTVDLPEHAAVGVPRRLGRGSRAVFPFARTRAGDLRVVGAA